MWPRQFATFAAVLALSCGVEHPGTEWPDGLDDPRPSVSPKPSTSPVPSESPWPIDPGSNEMALYKSGSRIKARVLRTGDGAQQFMGWFDTNANRPCFQGLTADGKQRCIWHANATVVGYSDPECEQMVAYAYAGCTQPELARLGGLELSPGAANCGVTAQSIWRVGPRYEGEVFTRSSSGCIKMARFSGYEYYTLAEEIPPDAFVEFHEHLE